MNVRVNAHRASLDMLPDDLITELVNPDLAHQQLPTEGTE